MKSALSFFAAFLVLGVLGLFLFSSSTFAQTMENTPSTTVSVPQDSHIWVQTVLLEILSATSCQLSGVDPLGSTNSCLGIDPTTHKIGYVTTTNGGAIGMMGGMLAALYTPPIHTGDYIKNVANNFGLVKHAYAVSGCDSKALGVGYCGIQPLLSLWIGFRNLVFLLFVLVFILIGIGIMLRIQIDPRTVMSIENSIPKIIIALLLVTFSFAIAGFLIDMMYLSIYVVFNFFAQPGLVPDDKHKALLEAITKAQGSVNGESPFGLLNSLFSYGPTDTFFGQTLITGAAGGVKDIVTNLFWVGTGYSPAENATNAFYGFLKGLSGGIVTGVLTAIWSTDWGKTALGGLLGYLGGGLTYIILMIAILVAMFRLWFSLLFAYINILIDIVLAPFFIVAGVFPGSPLNFEIWLRDVIAQLSSFVVTIAMFLLGRVFIDAFFSSNGEIFVPPLIGNPLTGHTATAAGATLTSTQGGFAPVAALIGVGIILMTPSIVNMMKEALKAPTFKYSAEAFKNVGSGQKVVGGAAGLGFGAYGAFAHGTQPVAGGAEGVLHYFTGKMASAAGGHG